MRKLAALTVGAVTLLAGMLASAPAQAHAPLHPDLASALAHEPGGVLVDASTVAWPHLGMTLRVDAAPEPRMQRAGDVQLQSVGACPTGRVCAFRSANLTGAMLSWISCGYFSTSALPGVGSIANALSSGTFQALNGASVVATVGAGGWTNVFGTVTNVRCSL